MSILRFDETKLLIELGRLTNRTRAAFAAACAERQFLTYVGYSDISKDGNPNQLAQALGCLWEDLEGTTADHGKLQAQLDVCMLLLPTDDSSAIVERVYAENAVATAIFAIQARISNNYQEAVWSARRAYESVDHYVIARFNPKIIEKNVEEYIISHPLVQAELSRQRADLSRLAEATNSASEKDAVADVQHRARTDATLFFSPKTS